MKRYFISTYILISIIFLNQHSLSATVLKASDHILNIFVGSPPALMFVEDAEGRISGADPAAGLDASGAGKALQNIPASFTDSDNPESDDPSSLGQPSDTTGWTVSIFDHPEETFTVNLLGLQTGVCELTVNGNYIVEKNIPSIRAVQSILVSKGNTRIIKVLFNPASKSLTIAPQVISGIFSRDTQAACELGAIGPPEACQVLEALASEVESAETKGDAKAEKMGLGIYLAVLNRLHNWGHEGSRKDWDDFKGQSECGPFFKRGWDGIKVFANDPAYAAVKLDVETLLNDLANRDDNGQGSGHK
jgi:hypothetical protein